MNPKKKRTYATIHPLHKKRLRELADEHGQVWVAARLGITASGVSRLLQPGVSGVRPGTLAAIGELVGKNGVEAAPKPRVERRPKEDLFAALSEVLRVLAGLSPDARARVLDAAQKLQAEGGA